MSVDLAVLSILSTPANASSPVGGVAATAPQTALNHSDTVELSLASKVIQLKNQGVPSTQIALTLGVTAETVSIELSTDVIQARLAAAPTLPAAVAAR